MRQKKILIKTENKSDKIAAMAKQVGISELLASILLRRGISDQQEAASFLYGNTAPYHDPFLLKDMEKAVRRVCDAVASGEKITIYGDYDVDGITASSLLYLYLKRLGTAVSVYIPVRKNEGYGLNTEAIGCIYASGTRLLISVDCGISSYEEVAEMPQDMDIIITDHHTPPDVLPAAYAVINPHQGLCRYPFKDLAGVGVAFKLCQALHCFQNQSTDYWDDMLELVAMGTVADIVPLLGENREIVKRGLGKIQETEIIGLRELMKICGCIDKPITSETIGFAIAPRLNAAGRLEHAMSAVELLTTSDKNEAAALALKLNNENFERQEISAQIFKEAEEMLEEQDKRQTAIILAKDGWHAGVIGIVASRLVDKYGLPSILISIDGDIGKGSCRGIPALNLYEALSECSDLLIQFGGHRQAAGLTIAADEIAAFRQKFLKEVEKRLTAEDYVPRIEADVIVPAEIQLTTKVLSELELLEPYGAGNSMPIFAFKQAILRNASAMGAEKNHLRLLVDHGTETYKGIMWNHSHIMNGIYNNCNANLAFYPKTNRWNGFTSIDLHLFAIEIGRNILDYRYYYESKMLLLKNILQTSQKTVVYVNKAMLNELHSSEAACTVMTYDEKLQASDAERVVFFDLPEITLFQKGSFPLTREFSGEIVLLYNQKDFEGWQRSSLQKYPDRKLLVSSYKYLMELLRMQGVAKLDEVINKKFGTEEVLTVNCLRIFEELGFIAAENGQVTLKSKRKNDLRNSPAFCELQEEYRQKLNVLQHNMRITAAQIAEVWESNA